MPMSPGPAFDRVYAALKDRLLAGYWPSGAHLEPGVIGDELGASITPVRDALHRLVGERLIEAPRHDGFWIPSVTEAELRELYAWRGGLLDWALRRQRAAIATPPPPPPVPPEPAEPASLFLALARAADNGELARAIVASDERLAPYRALESAVLAGVAEEHAEIGRCLHDGSAATLRRKLAGYHRRRERAAPALLAARRRALDPLADR
jgi:DNA-binding FadR family transcriptional regulator